MRPVVFKNLESNQDATIAYLPLLCYIFNATGICSSQLIQKAVCNFLLHSRHTHHISPHVVPYFQFGLLLECKKYSIQLPPLLARRNKKRTRPSVLGQNRSLIRLSHQRIGSEIPSSASSPLPRLSGKPGTIGGLRVPLSTRITPNLPRFACEVRSPFKHPLRPKIDTKSPLGKHGSGSLR